MPLIVLLALLVINNWLFSESIVLFPTNLGHILSSICGWVLLIILFFFISWCMGG